MTLSQWLGQRICALRGHTSVLSFEGKRMRMVCSSCGHEGVGIEITGQPKVTQPGYPWRHRLSRLRGLERKRA